MFLPHMTGAPVSNDLGIALNVAYCMMERADCWVARVPLMLQGGAWKLSPSELQRNRCLHGYASVRVFSQEIEALGDSVKFPMHTFVSGPEPVFPSALRGFLHRQKLIAPSSGFPEQTLNEHGDMQV